MIPALLATAVLAAVLLAAHQRRRRRARNALIRAERMALLRADHDRAIRQRDSLAAQITPLRRQVDVEAAGRRHAEFLAETYLTAWRRETRERRDLADRLAALVEAPVPAVVDELGELRQRRDARGRFARPESEAEVAR